MRPNECCSVETYFESCSFESPAEVYIITCYLIGLAESSYTFKGELGDSEVTSRDVLGSSV